MPTDTLTNVALSPQVLVNEKPDYVVNTQLSPQVLVNENPDAVVNVGIGVQSLANEAIQQVPLFGAKFISSSGIGHNNTVTAPTGIQVGDLIVAFVSDAVGGNDSWTCPGFTQRAITWSGDVNIALYTKIATSSEPSSYTFSVNQVNALVMLVYRNVAKEAPEAIGTTPQHQAADIVGPSITASQSGDLLIYGMANEKNPTDTSATPGFTFRIGSGLDLLDWLWVQDMLSALSGPTGTITPTGPSTVIQSPTVIDALWTTNDSSSNIEVGIQTIIDTSALNTDVLNNNCNGVQTLTEAISETVVNIDYAGTLAGNFPTAPVVDNFNRPDGSMGPNWFNIPLFNFDLNLVIRSNAAGSVAGTGTAGNLWYFSQFADCEAYVDIATVPTNISSIALYCRFKKSESLFDSNQSTGYAFQMSKSGSGIKTELIKYNTSSHSNIGTMSNQTFSAGDSIGISAIGSTITGWYKPAGGSWTIVQQATDATYNNPGWVGAECPDGGFIDNFGAGFTDNQTLVESSQGDVLTNTGTGVQTLLEVEPPFQDTLTNTEDLLNSWLVVPTIIGTVESHNSTNSITLVVPQYIQPGDLLAMCVSKAHTDTFFVSVDSSFSQVNGTPQGSGQMLSLWTKTATLADIGKTVTISHGGAGWGLCAILVVIRGGTVGNTAIEAAFSATVPIPTVTTLDPADIVVSFYGDSYQALGSGAWTANTPGMTLLQGSVIGFGTDSLSAFSSSPGIAGTVGGYKATCTGSGNADGCGFSFVVNSTRNTSLNDTIVEPVLTNVGTNSQQNLYDTDDEANICIGTQTILETISNPFPGDRISQIAVEVPYRAPGFGRVTQIAIEVVHEAGLTDTLTNIGTNTQYLINESPDLTGSSGSGTQRLSGEAIAETDLNTELGIQYLGFENPTVLINIGTGIQTIAEPVIDVLTNICTGIQILVDEGIIVTGPPRLSQEPLEVLRNTTTVSDYLSQITLEVLVPVSPGDPIMEASIRKGTNTSPAPAGLGGGAGVVHMHGRFRKTSPASSSTSGSGGGGTHMTGKFRKGG